MAEGRHRELQNAWRALSAEEDRPGWCTIPLSATGTCPLDAGRRFPGNEESVLFGVRIPHAPSTDGLPQGRGFRVDVVEPGCDGRGGMRLAVSRRAPASLDLFTMMAVDLIAVAEAGPREADERLSQELLGRIRAWQDFMQRGDTGLLSPNEEIGLLGEVVVLRTFVEAGMPPAAAVGAWEGPLGGLHDFRVGAGAVEVKTSVGPGPFVAHIGSLDQLDEGRRPLFVGAVALGVGDDGLRLPEWVDAVRAKFSDPSVCDALDLRLLHAGYVAGVSERYTRRFALRVVRMLHVDGTFPRLTRGRVPTGVIGAQYDVDLASAANCVVALRDALAALGGSG